MKSDRAGTSKILRKIGIFPLAAVIFFTVSGGPYGIEPLLGYAGSYAVPLLLITPLLWDVPTILVVLELNGLMPVEGGYYEWVKEGLGLRWAFFEGWWTWLYTFVDLAIYPVFFIEYAGFFFPQIEPLKIPVALAVIWFGAAINIRGIVPVGRTALVLAAVVMCPLFILVFTGLLHPAISAPHPHTGMPSIGMALFTIMWNFIGWDNASTYAGEVERPIRSYLQATWMAFSGIYLFYLALTYVAAHSGIPAPVFAEKGIPYLGGQIAGPSLGSLLSFGGMASMLGIFCAVLLSVSRIPAAMGKDNLIPKLFTRHHPRFNTPYLSILVCAGIVSLLILRPLADLLIMDICLYTAGITLEFAALIHLRKKSAHLNRPFRIPLGRKGLIVLFLAPLSVFGIALVNTIHYTPETRAAAGYAMLAILSAPVAWYVIRKGQKI